MIILDTFFLLLIKVLRPKKLLTTFVLCMERVPRLIEPLMIGMLGSKIEILTTKMHLVLTIQLSSMNSNQTNLCTIILIKQQGNWKRK